MGYDSTLLDVDFLVYSSHKTATQSVSHTLRASGYGATHCHLLRNLRMEVGSFRRFLDSYQRTNGRKLQIVTVFRKPLERQASSFFQWHGEGVIRSALVSNRAETIIATTPVPQLREIFIAELQSNPLQGYAKIGRPESLDQICAELRLMVSDLNYCPDKGYGVVELDCCTLYLLRFDTLAEDGVETVLGRIIDRPITRQDANISSRKWYADKYRDFTAGLRIPHSAIVEIYESRRPLIELMYPGDYDAVLSSELARFGSGN